MAESFLFSFSKDCPFLINNDIAGDGYKADFYLKEQLIKVSVSVSNK